MTTFRRRSGFALRRTACTSHWPGRRSGRRRQSRERPRFEVVVTLVQDRKGTLGGHALRRFLARPRTRGEQFAVHRDLGVKGPLVRGARRHLRNGEPVLYDLSSSYFEGRCCPLAVHGYSRDQRRGSLQIVYGLMCDRVGRPIAVRGLCWQTFDAQTVPNQVTMLRERFERRKQEASSMLLPNPEPVGR